MTQKILPKLLILFLAVFLAHCGTAQDSRESSSATTPSSSNLEGLPNLYSKFTSNVVVYKDGDQVVLQTDDLPNHPSPYYLESDPLYEAPDDGMIVNPNSIAKQEIVFRVPLNPEVNSTGSDTSFGPIGIATNGVVFYNDSAGMTASGDFSSLDQEIDTFDRFNGHPDQKNQYHYHMEPLFLTAADETVFIGVMMDGFPIYGPKDSDGSTPSDLDECNGHKGPTADYPDGIYHYHTTTQEPYLIGCFRGQPGTMTQ